MKHQRIIVTATTIAIAVGALVLTPSPAWAPPPPPNTLACATPCVDSNEIVNDTITNADVSASAAIAASKLDGSVVTTGENVSQLVNDAGYITQAAGAPLVVTDSLGMELGRFISANGFGLVHVALDINGEVAALTMFQQQYDADVFTFAWYESSDCSGTPYIDPGSVEDLTLGGWFKTAQVLPPGHSLYVESGPEVLINSESNWSGGQCSISSGQRMAIPMTFVEDLDQSFTPPFSVQ